MTTNIITSKNRAEWLEARKMGIGSSEVATILGVNPYETPYQLYRRKKGLDAPKEETFAMKAGHILEDAVAMFFQQETGKKIINSSKGDWLVVDKERPYLRVSPDRTYWLSEARNKDNKGILECKTTQKIIDPDDIPNYWFVQLQYQLGVSKIYTGSVAWLSSGRSFGYREFEFNEEFYSWMVEEVKKFWIDHIMANKEPDVINVADAMIKYSTHTADRIKEVGEDILKVYSDLKELKGKISELESKKKEFEDILKMQFCDAEAITYMGETLATWKTSSPSIKFDDKTFAKDHPDMYNSYIKETTATRRFLLK